LPRLWRPPCKQTMMQQDLTTILPAHFADSARVWIYQSNRPFTEAESEAVRQQVQAFAKNWLSHGAPVKGFGTVLYNHFIILMADETHTDVSGCSTDSSVRLIKAIEQQLGVELFNRQLLGFWIDDQVQLLPLPQLNTALEQGRIDADTPYFNNTVLTKKELLQQWLVPVRESWLGNKLIVKSE
jgi:hypothetical protein